MWASTSKLPLRPRAPSSSAYTDLGRFTPRRDSMGKERVLFASRYLKQNWAKVAFCEHLEARGWGTINKIFAPHQRSIRVRASVFRYHGEISMRNAWELYYIYMRS